MSPVPDTRSAPDDELPLLGLALLIGLVPPAMAVASGAVWGAEPTLGLIVCALAGAGLLSKVRERVARARGHKGEED